MRARTSATPPGTRRNQSYRETSGPSQTCIMRPRNHRGAPSSAGDRLRGSRLDGSPDENSNAWPRAARGAGRGAVRGACGRRARVGRPARRAARHAAHNKRPSDRRPVRARALPPDARRRGRSWGIRPPDHLASASHAPLLHPPRYHAAMAHPDLHLPLAAVQNCVLRGSSDVVSQASEPSEAARTWPRSPPRVHPRAASQLLRGGFDDPHHALAIGACGLAVSGLCGSMWLRHLEATLGPARTHAEARTPRDACPDTIRWPSAS